MCLKRLDKIGGKADQGNSLLRRNMIDVIQKAHFLFQKIIWPRSQTSRISGWRRQNSLFLVRPRSLISWISATHQVINEV
jgi:hypothetical protein